MSATAVILAAGQGVRAGTEIPKQLVKIAGRTLVEHAVVAFLPDVEHIIVVHPPGMRTKFEQTLSHLPIRLVEGGTTRNDSTRAALAHVTTNLVLIHDAVRPLVTHQTINRVLQALHSGAAAVDVVTPSTDTLVSHDGEHVTAFPNRNQIHRGQTPQGFRTLTLATAAAMVTEEFSDDCQLAHAAGFDITVVQGDETNIKVTHPGDFTIADRLFQTRRTTPAGEPFTGNLVVVGGTSGIGQALVQHVGGTALGTSTGFDVTNPDPNVFDGADVVVITAGAFHAGPLLEQTNTDIDHMLTVNLGGTINTARAAAKHLQATRGHLVLCASSSYTRGRANQAVYSATKAAIVALTQALAEEWPDVRVNCICPERTNTPMRRTAFPNENPATLMDPHDTAAQVAAMLGTPLTGQVFDIRR